MVEVAPKVVEAYNRIYVGHLSWDTTEDGLEEFFLRLCYSIYTLEYGLGIRGITRVWPCGFFGKCIKAEGIKVGSGDLSR